MSDLDDYLSGQYHQDKNTLAEVTQLANDLGKTLASTFDKSVNSWPYKIAKGDLIEPAKSQGTDAMVMVALLKLKKSKIAKKVFKDPNIKDVFDNPKTLVKKILKRSRPDISFSGTYGVNDHLTLSYLTELSKLHLTESDSRIYDHYNKDDNWDSIIKGLDSQAGFFDFSKIKKGKAKPEVVQNAFIPLKIANNIRVLFQQKNTREEKNLGQWFKKDTSKLKRFFETSLHDQLSYSSIPDSRFDPAQLAFCLEGLLVTQKDSVDDTLFRRVMDVLREAQNTSAFWRPSKPFLADSKGFTLFPISVEVANSIIRSCRIYDGDKIHGTYSSEFLSLFGRYWSWLVAQKVFLENSHSNKHYIGWDSEHVNSGECIHIWKTSQVLEFLLSYREVLMSHISRHTLALSRFSYTLPGDSEFEIWDDYVNKYEPVTTLGEDYKIYERLGKDFATPWKNEEPNKFSMLLYGPPGTGKSMLAKKLANFLETRLITITVSDFLSGGGAQLEARAKAIFEVLMAQEKCVVLFDEIDNFLLHRDSQRYRDQDTAFQFMTPGMLTKINDLREKENCIFLIATNYENRIDPAIKRQGRIDEKYLLLLPDVKRRRKMLEEAGGVRGAKWGAFDKQSLFHGFSAIASATKEGAESTDIAGIIESRDPAVRLQTYVENIKDNDTQDITHPTEEYIVLLALALQAKIAPSNLENMDNCKVKLRFVDEGLETFDAVLDHARKLIKT